MKVEDNEEKRIDRKKIYIITGATGFVGQRLVRSLVKLGDSVILFVRGNNSMSAKERVRTLFNFNTKEAKLVYVISCDIRKLHKIKNRQDFKSISNFKIDGIWHLAANLSFRSRDKAKVYETNFIGTQNIAKLARQLNTTLFHISTAYVHGKKKGLLKEDDLGHTEFNNVYEQIKLETEQYLQKEKESGLQVIVFRPSILIDIDERSDEHVLFGYYAILATIYDLSKFLFVFINTHPVLARLLGLRIDENGIIHSRVIPFIVTKSYLNLVPIDIAINIMFSVARSVSSNHGTFHVVSTNPLFMREIAKITFSEIKMNIPIVTSPKVLVNIIFKSIRILSRLFPRLVDLSKKLNDYGYYMTNTYKFDTVQISQVFGEDKYNDLFANTSKDLRIAARIFINKQTTKINK